MIESILDEHRDNWCDLTFEFKVNEIHIKTTIKDNIIDNVINPTELNFNADQFYKLQYNELVKQNPIQRIRELLHREKAVS
ncbi:hypothetical protein D3C77_767850 [compost metagenome]